MIRYALACGDGHDFESWFSSAESFDSLLTAGHVSCPDCGSSDVQKSLMAPGVRPSRKVAAAPQAERPLSTPRNEVEAAIEALRQKVESESHYVGKDFATEARAMHEGEVPMRSIYGEAKLDDAKKLVEDGVPVAPLPFTPRSRAN